MPIGAAAATGDAIGEVLETADWSEWTNVTSTKSVYLVNKV
jgi:hypothetical protein